MQPPASPSADSTPPVVPQPVLQRSTGHQAIIERRGQYYEAIHGWDGNLPQYSLECRADASYPCFAGPGDSYLEHIQSRYRQFRVMYQRVERGYRPSGQKQSIAKSQLIFMEMTSSGSSSLNFTFSYRVGHSWSLQCESTTSPSTSSLRPPGWMLPAISASFLGLLFWRRLRPVHQLLPVVDAIRERGLCQGIRLREWQRRDSIGAGCEGQGTLNYTTNSCAVQD